MRNSFTIAAVALTAWACQAVDSARAAVVVLANKTDHNVRFTVLSPPGRPREHTLSAGEVVPIPVTGSIAVTFSNDGKPRRYQLQGNTVYCFVSSPRETELKELDVTNAWGEAPRPKVNPESAKPDAPAAKPARVLVKIPVKILVDQAEPTVRRVWEKRLRERMAEASAILERYGRVQLEVTEVGTWESDPHLTTLTELRNDFQRKVAVKPARLAIGFTGRLAPKNGDPAKAITPEPLNTHIIIREWKVRGEQDRLEILLHELGHFLGACDSPEADSVMRLKVGDGRANHVAFRIGFDPLNILVLNLVAEELARGSVAGLSELTPATRKRLVEIYSTLSRLSPVDPMVPRAIRLLGGIPSGSLATRALPDGVADGAAKVVAAIVSAAEHNVRLPVRDGVTRGERFRRTGDALTAHYFQVAAAASQRLPPEHAAPAYLLGLAVALDRSSQLRALPLRGIAWEKIETDAQCAHRLGVLGEPTMHDKPRLAQNFVVSAALTTLIEGEQVSAGGIVEELLRVRSEDRWRFDDLSATLAGITFAVQLDASPGLLAELAVSFRIADYALRPAEEPVTLTREEFAHEYGSVSDERFLREEDALRKRLLALRGYQPRAAEK